MAIQTLNPFTNEVEKQFSEIGPDAIHYAIDQAHEAYKTWRCTPIKQRVALMKRVSTLLREKSEYYAKFPTLEMGKLFRESLDFEVHICADIADYYANNAEKFLQPEKITDVKQGEAYVENLPIGVLFGIMPWNFPYYQVFRFACPNLIAGNVVLIKHASNVPQCGIVLEDLFREAGFPQGCYTNLLISSQQTGIVIKDKRIRGVSLTGSEKAGSAVAKEAGRELKKAVMELGGSDPFIVLEDADLDKSVEVAIEGKMFNSGQCCAAAKRFILVESIADKFLEQFKKRMDSFTPGDPMSINSGYAPMVSQKERDNLLAVINKAIEQGATLVTGGAKENLPGAWLKPTIIQDVTPSMDIYYKELFGPVAVVYRVKDEEEAIRVANDSQFGLGSSIMSTDIKRAKDIAKKLHTGMTYINTYTISEPELPFGGIKNSGFGRELSHLGIEEFLNKKLIRVL